MCVCVCVFGGGPGLLTKMFPFFNNYRRITLQLYISLFMDRPLVVVTIITNLSSLILHVAVWWLVKDGWGVIFTISLINLGLRSCSWSSFQSGWQHEQAKVRCFGQITGPTLESSLPARLTSLFVFLPSGLHWPSAAPKPKKTA